MKTLIQVSGIVLLIAGTFLVGQVLGDSADDPGGITLSAVLRSLTGFASS